MFRSTGGSGRRRRTVRGWGAACDPGRRWMGALRPWLALAALLLALAPVDASLDRLRKFQRTCFKDVLPCVMILNERGMFGCGQCNDDTLQEPVLEFNQTEVAEQFLAAEGGERRVLMLPELIFFKVLDKLELFPRNVAAVVVYRRRLDREGFPIPDPPPPLSSDNKDPNHGYNHLKQDESDPKKFQLPSINVAGTRSQFRFYEMNIFRVTEEVAALIRERIAKYPSEDEARSISPITPRYKLQSNGRMWACPSKGDDEQGTDENSDTDVNLSTDGTQRASSDSQTCLEDRTCLPIGGQSVWSSLEHLDATRLAENREILAITAPMDSTAFFHDLALGAAAEISSLATMMAVAEMVGKYRRSDAGRDKRMLYQPTYFAWHAQAWGYAGSSRFLEDVANFTCNKPNNPQERMQGCKEPFMPSLKFLDFQNANFTVLNLGSLISQPRQGNEPISNKFFKQGRRKVSESPRPLESALTAAFGENLGDGDRDVPSLDASQSFATYLPNVESISLTNYETNFTNDFYHSVYDSEALLDSEELPESESLRPLYQAAENVARAVISMAFNDSEPDIKVDTAIIDDFLRCLTGNWTSDGCDLAGEYLGKPRFEDLSGSISPGNHPGVFVPATRWDETNPSGSTKVTLVESFLAYHNRYESDVEGPKCQTKTDCQEFSKSLNESPASHSELRVAFCSRGVCIASDTFRHNAYGTALKSKNKDQSDFEVIPDATETSPVQAAAGMDSWSSDSEPTTGVPRAPAWTESYWDDALGLCGVTEDTGLFGGLILGAGILVFVLSMVITFGIDRVVFKPSSEVDADTEAPLLPAARV